MYVTTSQCNEENLYLNVVPPVQVISKIRRHPAQLSHRNQRLHSNKFIQHNGIFVVCLSSRIYVSCLLCTVSPVTHTASLSPFSSHIYQHANRKKTASSLRHSSSSASPLAEVSYCRADACTHASLRITQLASCVRANKCKHSSRRTDYLLSLAHLQIYKLLCQLSKFKLYSVNNPRMNAASHPPIVTRKTSHHQIQDFNC
jgi:hypothetical protein